MSYGRQTLIMGRREGQIRCIAKAGHWQIENAIRAARNTHKLVGPLKVTHATIDYSGGGRGGNDRRWYVEEDGTARIVGEYDESI